MAEKSRRKTIANKPAWRERSQNEVRLTSPLCIQQTAVSGIGALSYVIERSIGFDYQTFDWVRLPNVRLGFSMFFFCSSSSSSSSRFLLVLMAVN